MLKWFWLLRSRQLRIPALLLGFWLLFTGCERVRHPALVMISKAEAPPVTETEAGFQPVLMTTSRVSSARGMGELVAGAGLVFYIGWPLILQLKRRS